MDTKTLLDRLAQWGCDIPGALERMLGDEDFYISLLLEYQATFNPSELRPLLQAHDTAAAFDAAHTMKGVLGNLGLTPLYDILVQIVEPLRQGHDKGLLTLVEALEEKKADFDGFLAEYRAANPDAANSI